jgi:hypothetical protein
VQQYLAVLDRQDWCDTVRADRDSDDSDSDFYAWFADTVAARLHLRSFIRPDGR